MRRSDARHGRAKHPSAGTVTAPEIGFDGAARHLASDPCTAEAPGPKRSAVPILLVSARASEPMRELRLWSHRRLKRLGRAHLMHTARAVSQPPSGRPGADYQERPLLNLIAWIKQAGSTVPARSPGGSA